MAELTDDTLDMRNVARHAKLAELYHDIDAEALVQDIYFLSQIAWYKIHVSQVDAIAAYDTYKGMTHKELVELQAALEIDQTHATTPTSIAFCAGRLALLAAVLKTK